MDGGAQASMTDRLDYLFYYCSLPTKSATLKVADNTPHYPIGSGYLHVAAHTAAGYIMVPTFYTPTLPATIVSPSDLGSKLGCLSFTTFASLSDMECCLTLHHLPAAFSGYQDSTDSCSRIALYCRSSMTYSSWTWVVILCSVSTDTSSWLQMSLFFAWLFCWYFLWFSWW